jgi:hypothetical protein
MKSAAQTKRPPSKETPRASRDTTAVRGAEKETRRVHVEAPRAAAADGNTTSPMPNLSGFGIEHRDAQAHVGQCEACGRAYRHVVKNPKDVMALESFGRHLASCLAGKQVRSHA